MAIAVGEKIPSVKVLYMGPEGPSTMITDELFGGGCKEVAAGGVAGVVEVVVSRADAERHEVVAVSAVV